MNAPANITKGQRTHLLIVETAAAAFWRRSFHGVSMSDLADEAGVNKATLYRYFPDKNAIAFAVVHRHGDRAVGNVFDHAADTIEQPDARLAMIYAQIAHGAACMRAQEGATPGCPILALAMELALDLPDIRAKAEAVFNRVEAHFRDIAALAVSAGGTDCDPDILARTLVQLLHGAFASSRLADDPDRILDAGRASLALIGFPDTPFPTLEKTP